MAFDELELGDLLEEGMARLMQDKQDLEKDELIAKEQETNLQARCLQNLRTELPKALHPYLKFWYWYDDAGWNRPQGMVAMIEIPDWAPIRVRCELTWTWDDSGKYIFERSQIAKTNKNNNAINPYEVCTYKTEDTFDQGWMPVLRQESAYLDIYRALARAEELGNNLEQAEEICRRNKENDAIKRLAQPAASLQDQLVDVLNRFIQAELEQRLGVSCGE